jgi:type II secretory pathway pseudopilin PulG
MRRGGFTLVEALFAMVLVGGLLVAVLTAVGQAKTGQHRIATRRQARLLAEQMRTEINLLPFQDPSYSSGALSDIGHASNEGGDDRSGYDDADDYHGWSAGPPQEKDGTKISWAGAFTRQVTVHWVPFFAPYSPTATKTGMKLFIVTVSWRSRRLAEIQWNRTVYEQAVWQRRQQGW